MGKRKRKLFDDIIKGLIEMKKEREGIEIREPEMLCPTCSVQKVEDVNTLIKLKEERDIFERELREIYDYEDKHIATLLEDGL